MSITNLMLVIKHYLKPINHLMVRFNKFNKLDDFDDFNNDFNDLNCY